MDPHQPRLPPPPGAPRAYRPPRAANYHEDEDEGEDYWNATASEDKQQLQQNETAPVSRENATDNTNTVSSRLPPPRRRVTQHHHRDDPLTLSYKDEEYPGPSLPSGRDRPPRPGGDVYHLPQPGSRHANPFAPLNRPHKPERTSYDGFHEQYPTMQHSPPQGYPMSPAFGGAPPLYQPPLGSYFPGPGGFPPSPHGGRYYPPSHPPPNPYPGHPGCPGFGNPRPYAGPTPIILPYDDRQAHVADSEVEKLRRQVRKLEMRDRAREEQQREEDATRRRQERRERREMEEQEKLRQGEFQSRREMEAKLLSRRNPVNQDPYIEISEKKVEKMVNAASDYIAATRPNRGKNRGLQDDGINDTGDILVAIKEFVEERLQRQERLGFEERSMKSAKSGKSTATARRGNRLEIIPYEQEVDVVTRTQIESIVIDVLQRVGLRGPVQETSSPWDKSTFISARPLSIRSPNHGYDDRYGESEPRPGPGHHDSYEKRQLDPRTLDSQGQFSDRTAVELNNQYRPLEIDPNTIRLRKPPGPENQGEKKRQSNTPTLRVRTSTPANDYFQEIHDQSAEDEYTNRPTKQGAKGHATTGNDMLKRRPEKEQKRRRPRKVLVSDTDESDDLHPRREEGQYAGKLPRGSRRDRVAPPPTVPDAPQADPNPGSTSHKATVITDAEEYD